MGFSYGRTLFIIFTEDLIPPMFCIRVWLHSLRKDSGFVSGHGFTSCGKTRNRFSFVSFVHRLRRPTRHENVALASWPAVARASRPTLLTHTQRLFLTTREFVSF
jgi:hypothetical protein